MKTVILTEGGKSIGFGHITRGLSLCQAYEARGYQTEFIVKGDDSVKAVLGEREIYPKYRDQLLGRKAKNVIEKEDVVQWEDVE